MVIMGVITYRTFWIRSNRRWFLTRHVPRHIPKLMLLLTTPRCALRGTCARAVEEEVCSLTRKEEHGQWSGSPHLELAATGRNSRQSSQELTSISVGSKKIVHNLTQHIRSDWESIFWGPLG